MKFKTLFIWAFAIGALFLNLGFIGNSSAAGNSIELVYSGINTDRISLFFPPDSLNFDSLAAAAAADSVSADSTVIDSLLLDPRAVDSTARLKYFTYERKDNPGTEFSPARRSAFFIYPTSVYAKREVKLDSTQQYVIITETISGIQIKPELKIPLEEYIELKRDEVNNKLWTDLAYKYEMINGRSDLSDIFSQITNIDIPLPSTSFLSIFGPPVISLRISGSVDIHGAWRNETTEGLTASALGNSRNEPDFKQQVQINVSGTIGDKLTIGADWNTERTFEYENQLKLKYTGYEDEIIQSIEAGNVSLQTSPLVGGSEALFGIKAKFQMGPFTLTALASQKKGEVQEKSVSGGSEKETFEKRAYDYSQNHYFLDQVYADTSAELNIWNKYYGNPTAVVVEQYRVKQLEVWKTVDGNITGFERKGNAFLDLQPIDKNGNYDAEKDSTLESIPGSRLIGYRWVKLEEGSDYTLHPETGWITVNQIQNNEALAVAYRYENIPNSSDDDLYYGEFIEKVQNDTSNAIVLKLIKPRNPPTGSSSKAWNLQLRNIYPIGGREIKEDGFKFDIRYIIEGQEPVNEINGNKMVRLFGFDITDASKQGPPDGEFDWAPPRTIMPATGEIIFPVLQPFGKNSPLPDSLRYQAVYDTSITYAKQDKAKDKFLLQGEYTADVSSVISIGFNVVENSVRVTLGGRELKEGSDYRVDYNIGQVTILNDAALVSGADLKISYEQNDLFQLASKTLLGLRGVYEFNKNTTLGFSYLNLNQQTLSDKVRIGEEPLNNSIMGVDFKTKVELPFLTKGLDYIFSTKQMSNFNLNGEFAYMRPDPNTKKSNITGDGGKSIAYIDDFEGAKRIIPIGIAYGSWKDISPPNDLPYIGKLPDKMDLMNYKAKTFWFNMLPSNVFVNDIWGDRKQVSQQDRQVTVLDYVYRPNVRGAFNYNSAFDPESDTLYKNWGGMMKLLSTTANNLIEQNIEYIEFWMKVDAAPQDAKLYIDLGQISEDVIPNGVLNTEDKNQNDLVDEGEDIGIDMIPNSEEKLRYPDLGSDPSLDNFIFGNGDRYKTDTYVGINGTEGNAALTDIGRFPDTEDLNRNFTLDRVNSYFRYEIPIDTNRQTNPYIAGGGDGLSWYQFKIPLKEFKEKIGNPGFDFIESIRLWTADANSEVHLRLAEFNLVGNQWQKILIPGVVEAGDTVLNITTVNIEDNPEYYPPSDNLRERDRTKPDEQIYKNEQSLNLQIRDLEAQDKREIVKYLFRPLDLFNYKELKLFVHGPLDESIGSLSFYESEQNHASDVYIRFGSDTLNYYEYREPLRADWHDIRVIFEKLTAIKSIRTNPAERFTVPVEGKPGHYYAVKGNPALTKVTFFEIGIKNAHPRNNYKDETALQYQKISGDFWVNEMRVLGADDTPGWAYSASTSLQMADLITVNANMSQTDPYFHKLSDRFGSKQDRRAWGFSSDIDVLKFLPVNLSGSNLRISYSHNESITNPLYLPGTDIKVDAAAEEFKKKIINEGATEAEANRQTEQLKSEAQTASVTDTWSMSNVQIKIPSNKWYIRDTFNSLKWNFNYNKSFSRNPTTLVNSSWLWNAGLNYNVNFSKDLFFYPANIPIIGWVIQLFKDYRNAKIYFAPQNFTFGVTANRKYSYVENRNTTTEPNIQRDFTSKRNFGFLYKLTEGGILNFNLNYSASFQSSLAYLLLDKDGFDRPEDEIWNDILNGHFFGKDYNFKQQVDLKLSPKLPSLWGIDKYFTITARYSVGYTWQNNFQQEDIGRSAGFSNSISAGLTLRWKSLTAPLFAGSRSSNTSNRGSSRRRNTRGRVRRGGERNVDAELKGGNKSGNNAAAADNAETDSTGVPKTPVFIRALGFIKGIIQWAFFDYDQFALNFSQSNSKSGSGIAGIGTGFKNFWGITDTYDEGPDRLFMLGLSYDLGPRAPNGTLSDNYSQKNTIDFKTSRPLWKNANIDINWKVGWGMNKTTSFTTDDYGNITINNITASGNLDKSFLSLPPFLIINSGIKKVNELYQSSNPDEGNANSKLSDAFINGMESIPLLSTLPVLKEVAQYVPRPNWRLSWSGLESLPILKKIAKRISLNHAYTSSYNEGWRINVDGEQEIQTQKVVYGFSPLIGLNMTFNKFLGGDLTGSIKFSQKTAYDLGASTRNITQTYSKDINITASFSKSGFEIPLFGLALKNDVEISLSYTSGQNSVVVFEMDNFKEEGKPQDGTIRTTMEPRIKYVMSSRVTLALFYKRTSVEPQGASRIPPTTTNEAGLDVHIAIQ